MIRVRALGNVKDVNLELEPGFKDRLSTFIEEKVPTQSSSARGIQAPERVMVTFVINDLRNQYGRSHDV